MSILQAEHASDLLKISPVAAFVSTSLAGFPWGQLSYALASLYTALMIGNFVWVKMLKPRRAKPSSDDDPVE